MLTNKQIHTALKKKKKEVMKFAKFMKMSRQALEFRLKSDDKKNNLDGMFREYLVEEKDNE